MAFSKRKSPQHPSRLPSVVAPIVHHTIVEQIAGSIREAIAQGRIPPAARLLEVASARDMRTSRAPVREALRLVQREGLAIKEPNRESGRARHLAVACLGRAGTAQGKETA